MLSRQILFIAGLLGFELIASAAPCTNGTLASYIALGSGGCTLGSIQVAGFAYKASANGGAAKITADQITVTPLLAPVGSYALEFSAPWSVQSLQSQGSHISYHVVSPTASVQVQQVSLDGTGFQAGMFGNVIVNETVGTPTASYDLRAYLKCEEVCRSQTSSVATLKGGASALVVADRVTLQSKLGSASLSSFVDWLVSSAGESHPGALSEPCLNVSAHTAPAMEPRRTPICQCAHNFGSRLEIRATQ